MALQAFDGFDHYKSSADMLARSGFLQWQFPNAGPVNFTVVSGLTDRGKAINWAHAQGGSDNQLRAVFAARNAEWFASFRANIPVGCSLLVAAFDGVANLPQVTLLFSAANYSIIAWRGNGAGTMLGVSNNNVWTGATNQFFEFRFKIDGSSGAVEVKVNNVTALSLTGINTKATSNAWADSLDIAPALLNGLGNPSVTIDDFKYNDTSSGPGSAPFNSWSGDFGVRTQFATGNDSVQWSPLANSNWQEISEVAMDSDTTYNFSTTAGQQDTFNFQSLTGTIVTLAAVQLTYAARKDDGGSRTIESVVSISGTSYFGTTNSLTNTYAYFTDLWVTNPATSLNWTGADVNGASYGYKIIS